MADKTKKTAPIPESLWKRVCDEAKKEFRTPEQQLAWIVDQYFRRGICGGTVQWNIMTAPARYHDDSGPWPWVVDPSPLTAASNKAEETTFKKGL